MEGSIVALRAKLAAKTAYTTLQYTLKVQHFGEAGLYYAPPLTLAHWRAERPQRAMKPAAAASSKVLLGS